MDALVLQSVKWLNKTLTVLSPSLEMLHRCSPQSHGLFACVMLLKLYNDNYYIAKKLFASLIGSSRCNGREQKGHNSSGAIAAGGAKKPNNVTYLSSHFESQLTIYSYFDFGLKNSSFRLPYQRPSSSADCARELFNGSNGSASLLVCTRKNFLVGSCGFFVSDVISEVVFGPFWLMLPGLEPKG